MQAISTLNKLYNSCKFPILFMNSVGMIGVAITLIALGQWEMVVIGFFAGAISCQLIDFAFAPGLIFISLFKRAALKGRRGLCIVLLVSSLVYDAIWIGAWCVVVFDFFAQHSTSKATFTLLALWSYGVATSPLTWILSHDNSDSLTSFIFTLFAQIALLTIALTSIFLGASVPATQIIILSMILSVSYSIAVRYTEISSIFHDKDDESN